LASTKKCEGYTEVFEVSKLLQIVWKAVEEMKKSGAKILRNNE